MTTEHPAKPMPALVSEFQLVVVFADGAGMVIPCPDEWTAHAKGRRISSATKATYRVEMRHVTMWRAVSAPMPVKVDPGAGLRGRRDLSP